MAEKTPWSTERRPRFEKELQNHGWFPNWTQGERRFAKEGKSIYVDDGGLFVYENGVRVLGLSDDLVDASPVGFLHFYHGEILDLKTGGWVSK